MKHSRKKLSNIIFKTVGVFILLILFVNIINTIILKTTIPAKYNESQWVGDWQSEDFSLIGGKIMANLPKDIPINEEFEVDLFIYYNIWGLYNMGGINEFKLKGMLEDDSAGGGNSIEENIIIKSGLSSNFKAKVSSISGQKIEYLGISNTNKSLIVGGYKSTFPFDIGVFKMTRKE